LRHLIAARETLMRPEWRGPRNREQQQLSSPEERWSIAVAATVAGTATLLLLVYMSQQWNPL
jgi:hypothetical protein